MNFRRLHGMEISPGSLSSDVAATPRTSTVLCDICSRINIESLSSPEGFPHFYKKKLGSCYLCDQIFYDTFGEQMDETPFRIKLFQGQTKMGLVTWFLRIERGKKSIPTEVAVFTREGWRFVSFHRRWSADFSQVIQLRSIMAYLHSGQ